MKKGEDMMVITSSNVHNHRDWIRSLEILVFLYTISSHILSILNGYVKLLDKVNYFILS